MAIGDEWAAPQATRHRLRPWYSGLVTANRLVPLKASLLATGDVLVYLVATVLGFATHEELVLAAWGRIVATLVSFILAWFLISPWIVGSGIPNDHRQARLWRPALAAIYAAPLGAWLRGLWIGAPIQYVFVAVMGAVTAALMIVWRAGVWPLISRSG